MAYATYTDVQSEFKNITFDANSKLTSTEVTEIITQTENYINARLAEIYTTPVTNTTDISIVKRISIYFTKHRAEEILRLRSGEELDSEDQHNLKQEAKDLLNEVIDKKLLHNTTRVTSNNYGVEDYNSNNSIHATFDPTNELEDTDYSLKHKDFW